MDVLHKKRSRHLAAIRNIRRSLKICLHSLMKEKVAVDFVNEYGKEGIDGKLLREVGTVLDEINNGSIFCSCRLDKFEEVLKKALASKPDVILIEASGLSNPVNVRKIMAQEEKFPGLEYMGSICLLDARRFHKVYETATVVKKQIGISDIVLINKTDLAAPEEISRVRRTLRSYVLKISEGFSLYELEKFTEMFLADTYRVKGFVKLQGERYLLDCVRSLFSISRYDGEVTAVNEIVILAGNGLPAAKSKKEAMKWYPEKVISFTPAKQ